MARLTISMPDDMSEFITAQIETGKYDNVSEYMRDLVRHEQDRKKAAFKRVRARLERSANSGAPVPIKEAFDSLEAMHQQQLAGGNGNVWRIP